MEEEGSDTCKGIGKDLNLLKKSDRLREIKTTIMMKNS